MARLRNRMVKAEFWSDPELLRWPREKRWTYQGLWESAEDSGCLEDDPFGWKLQLWPSPLDADITLDVLAGWRDELIEAGKLIPYEAGGKRYLYCARFHQHEHPRNPQRPDLPLPPWVTFRARELQRKDSGRGGTYTVNEYIVDEALIPSCGNGTVALPQAYRNRNETPVQSSPVQSSPVLNPKEEAAVVARAREGGGGHDEQAEDDPLLWDLWEVPGWPRDDALDRRELSDVRRDYPRANLSEVIADLRAEAPLKHPRKALRAFARQAHERAPTERPTPPVLPALPETTPEQKAANLAEARRAREKIAAMAAGMGGTP